MIRRPNRLWLRRLTSIGLLGLTGITLKNLYTRYRDVIEEGDEFSTYTNAQQRKHFFSGMHQPFLTKDPEQLSLFEKHFSQFQFLIAENVDEIKEKHSLKTPVRLKSLSEYSNTNTNMNTETLIVGGAPALVSAFHFIDKKEEFVYLNDSRRIPISNGSAWHLEQDAQTEAPTNYKPTKFLFDQIKRLLLYDVSLKHVSETGEFPWRTIDWMGWIRHPEHWYRALKLSLKFQWFTMFDDRTNLLNDVARQCFINERFFRQLNELLSNELLLEDHGSVIVARNEEEINQLQQLKNDLSNEGRHLHVLSKEKVLTRYGFLPKGLMFGEKAHDRVLVANFLTVLTDFLKKKGGHVVDGTMKTVYVDEKHGGGVAVLQNSNGEEKSVKFSRLILSLGSQEIYNLNNQRLFDVVAARGVSVLAHVYLPKGCKLPPVLVCGGTNHATRLSSGPISSDEKYDLYLMRFTAGACITPNVSDHSTSSYDGTIATGLVTSVRSTLGDLAQIKVLLVYGCNRQVSQFGQINWIEPYKDVFVQYGAAGGGLTRAPDFITHLIDKGIQ